MSHPHRSAFILLRLLYAWQASWHLLPGGGEGLHLATVDELLIRIQTQVTEVKNVQRNVHCKLRLPSIFLVVEVHEGLSNFRRRVQPSHFGGHTVLVVLDPDSVRIRIHGTD